MFPTNDDSANVSRIFAEQPVTRIEIKVSFEEGKREKDALILWLLYF